MKKLFPFLLIVVLIVGAWYFISSSKEHEGGATSTPVPTANPSNAASGHSSAQNTDGHQPTLSTNSSGTISPKVHEAEEDEDVRPATEIYKTATEALEAVKKGALDYDDVILEQFVDLGEDCTWCTDFYHSVRDLMLAPDSSQDQKSYFAELLAVSGKVDNVSALVEAIEQAPNQDTADLFAEALEVAVGDDQTVRYLGDKLDSKNDSLKESVLAALTNHGSRLAIDIIYQHTVKAGDPDGFYSLGIGLGEVIPDEESVPYLTDLLNKRDAYSHLALKSLLNYGVDGLRIVVDALANSKDADFDRQMLKDAVDHVSFEDQTEEYLRKLKDSSNSPVVQEFAKQVLEDFDLESNEAGVDGPEIK